MVMQGGTKAGIPTSRLPPRDTLDLFKPSRTPRAFEDIIGQIRMLLREGRLVKGDKLPAERTLAATLQVNRHTVREALRALEISGIVELRRGARGGAFIINPEGETGAGLLGRSLRFTDVAVIDLTRAMRAITMMLFEAALPTIDENDLSAMEANLVEAERTADANERSAVIIRFYRQLAEASRNQILVEIANGFCEILCAWVLRLGSLGSERVVASRRVIIASLRLGDRPKAQIELDRYLTELHALWLEG